LECNEIVDMFMYLECTLWVVDGYMFGFESDMNIDEQSYVRGGYLRSNLTHI